MFGQPQQQQQLQSQVDKYGISCDCHCNKILL
jgi:hypothetical protein